MYHSIKFIREEDIGNLGVQNSIKPYLRDTYDNWFLIPTTRPFITPPKFKTNYIDVPGSDSRLDFSTALTGYPLYEDREGSWTFMIDHYMTEEEWFDIYSDIMDWLQGERMCCILEDDSSWYYIGRFYVSGINSEKKYTTLTISYTVKPYKRAAYIDPTTMDWIWDNFDFVDGVLSFDSARNITVDSDEYVNFNVRMRSIDEWYDCFSREPVIPLIKVEIPDESTIDILFQNNSLKKPAVEVSLKKGSYKVRNIIFGGRSLENFIPKYYPGTNWLMGDINGDGKVTAVDASEILRIYSDPDLSFDTRQRLVGDLNQDGMVTSVDASLLLANLTTEPINYLISGIRSFTLKLKGHGKISFLFIPGRL